MKQSLPGITAVFYLPCSALVPNVMAKHLAKIPVGVFSTLYGLAVHGDGECEAESSDENGSNSEKTTLQFTTTDEIPTDKPLAFVVEDANHQFYLIGAREKPYPIVEASKRIDPEKNVFDVKVTFTAQKSLIPCIV